MNTPPAVSELQDSSVPTDPPASPGAAAGKRYQRYCLLVTILMIALKLWIAPGVPASGMFADEYDYLNKSIYFVRGDLALTGYPYTKVQAGITYPIVLAPWMLFRDPAVRMFVVHAINILLSGVFVYFGSRTVARLIAAPSWLAPLCLASFGPVFLFSYYAMTENLIFALLAVLTWLVVDFEKTCKHRVTLAALLAVAALLPLTRASGIAVCPGLLALVWLNRKTFPGWRAAALGAAIVSAAMAPYLLYMTGSPPSPRTGATRESIYIAAALKILRDPEHFALAVRLGLSQLRYLFASTGYWILPVLMVAILQFRRRETGPDTRRWANTLGFAAISGATLVAFGVLHVIQKIKFDSAGASFIYGRYNDPAGVLLLIGGVAAVSLLRRQTRLQALLLRVAAPLALWWVMTSINGVRWNPPNQSGLAIFATYSKGILPKATFIMWLLIAAAVVQVTPFRRWRATVLLAFLIAFNCLTVTHGMRYTRGRANRAAHPLKVAAWIHDHVPPTARIGYDDSVCSVGAPHGLKAMYNVYRAMMFATYPRPVTIVREPAHLTDCEYLYTLTTAENPRGLPVAWTDGDYVLYKVPSLPGESTDNDTAG